MPQLNIPLNKLLLSPRNARKTDVDVDIESLADSIHSKGLLQNLVVSESPTGKGFYEVDAGGRRWRALQLLVERKLLQRNWPVPCLLVPRDDAAEASLAENLHKIAMNPADEYLAFATIIDGYEHGGIVDRAERIENCARRFGVTIRHVEQRLRLAALAPEIVDALRESRITVDAARAYAGHPDHKLQLKIFAVEQKKGSWGHSQQAVRDAIKGRVYLTDHEAVIYVGLDAYREAGGRVERDLFLGAEDREILLDPAIVDRLAAEKAGAEATVLAQQSGYADGVLKPWNGQTWADPKAPKGYQATWRAPEQHVRAEAIVGFEIAEDGSGLKPIERYYVKEQVKPAAARVGETEADRLARVRKQIVELRAARLATPALAGTPLDGRAFWPNKAHWIDALSQNPDGDFEVALLIKVSAEDVAAAREQAEWQLTEEEAAADAAAAADGADVAELEGAIS